MGITVVITLVTVVVEFVLGMALAMVMNKIVIPRRTLRTVILIPYAIITVVSAFAWKYAFARRLRLRQPLAAHLTSARSR